MKDPLIDLRTRRLQQLRLRDLRLLEAIDRHGTLQGAARALFVTQPAVSQALRSLEDTTGVTLAVRSRRGVVLTDAGRTLRTHLQAAHASLVAGLAQLHAPAPRPVLRLGTIPYALIDTLPAALARLRDAPFEVHVVSGAVDALMQALREGRVDAIVSRAEPPARRSRADEIPLQATPLASIRNAIAAGRDHPLARRRPTLEAMAEARWVLPDDRTLARRSLDQLFARAGLRPPVPWVVSGNFADNLRIAAAARLLTVAPVDVIDRARPAMRVLLEPPGWASVVSLVCALDRADWPPLAALRTALATGAAPRR